MMVEPHSFLASLHHFGWGHLFEYCSPEYAELLKQRKPVEGLPAAAHMRKGSSSAGGTDRVLHPEDRLTEAEQQRLDDLRMDASEVELSCPTDPQAAAGEGGQGQCWDAGAALPSVMAMSPPPYLPTYRDRFFTADGLTCGSTGTMVVSHEGLDRLVGNVANETVGASLRQCMDTALQTSLDAINVSVQSCLLQHTIVGSANAGKSCSLVDAGKNRYHLECVATGGAWACGHIMGAPVPGPRVRCQWADVGAPGTAVAYKAVSVAPGKMRAWQDDMAKVHMQPQLLFMDNVCEQQPTPHANLRGRPPVPWCGGRGEPCTHGVSFVASQPNGTQQAAAAPGQPTSDPSQQHGHLFNHAYRPSSKNRAGWAHSLFPDTHPAGCQECADRQLAADMAAAQKLRFNDKGNPMSMEVQWNLMLAAAAAAAAALLLMSRHRVVTLLRGAPHETVYTPAPSQLRQAAASALRDATVSGNVNKLVAAIDAAEKEGVAEPLIAKARQQLRQKQLRRSGGQRHGSASSKVTKDRPPTKRTGSAGSTGSSKGPAPQHSTSSQSQSGTMALAAAEAVAAIAAEIRSSRESATVAAPTAGPESEPPALEDVSPSSSARSHNAPPDGTQHHDLPVGQLTSLPSSTPAERGQLTSEHQPRSPQPAESSMQPFHHDAREVHARQETAQSAMPLPPSQPVVTAELPMSGGTSADMQPLPMSASSALQQVSPGPPHVGGNKAEAFISGPSSVDTPSTVDAHTGSVLLGTHEPAHQHGVAEASPQQAMPQQSGQPSPPPSPKPQPHYSAPDTLDAAAAIAAQPPPMPRRARQRPPKPQQQDAPESHVTPPVSDALCAVAVGPWGEHGGADLAAVVAEHNAFRSRSPESSDKVCVGSSAEARLKSGRAAGVPQEARAVKLACGVKRPIKDVPRPSVPARPGAAPTSRTPQQSRGADRSTAADLHHMQTCSSGGLTSNSQQSAQVAATQLSPNAKEYLPAQPAPQAAPHTPPSSKRTSWGQTLLRLASGRTPERAPSHDLHGDADVDAWHLPEESVSPFFGATRLATSSFHMPTPKAAPQYDASATTSAAPPGATLYPLFTSAAHSADARGSVRQQDSTDSNMFLRQLDAAMPVGPIRPTPGGADLPQSALEQRSEEPLRFVDDPVVGLPSSHHSSYTPFPSVQGGWGGPGTTAGGPASLGLTDLGGRRDVLAGMGLASSSEPLRHADALATIRSPFGSGGTPGSGHRVRGTSPAGGGGSGASDHMLGGAPASAPPDPAAHPSLGMGLGFGSLGFGGGMWGVPAGKRAPVQQQHAAHPWVPAVELTAADRDEQAWAALAAADAAAGLRADSADLGERTAKAALAKLWE